MLSAVLWAGCDAALPPLGLDARPPTVSELVLTPGAALLDTLAVQSDTARVTLNLALRAEPGDAPVARAAYAVEWQFTCRTGPDVTGVLEPTGEGRYAGAVDLVLPRGRRGAYRVTTWAVDANSRPSNEAATTFTFRAPNLGPPAIAEIDAPATLRPPATLRFRVTVTDPDGIDDIARAEVETPGAGTFPLADDGASGDGQACDGTFGASFSIPAGVPAGPQTFVFRAYDRDGLASEPVPFTVEVQG